MICFETSPIHPAQLMELAAALHELASDVHSLQGVPEALVAATGLAPLTFVVVETCPGRDQRIVHQSTAHGPAEAAPWTQGEGQLDLLHLAGATPDSAVTPCHSTGNNSSAPLIVRRSIDGCGCLLLICPPADTAAMTMLNLAADHLAKVLAINLRCQCEPSHLGEPYVHLTEREWEVLRALNSEEGEKQLADRLGLSPHTLHSHIKAIYRKVGVQGRLQLLQRLQQSLRERRVRLWVRPTAATERVAG